MQPNFWKTSMADFSLVLLSKDIKFGRLVGIYMFYSMRYLVCQSEETYIYFNEF